MYKNKLFSILSFMLCLILATSCSKFRKIQKSDDWKVKYDAAFNYYESKDYYKAKLLFEEILPIIKGTKEAEKAQFYYAYSHFYQKLYTESAFFFKSFYDTYSRSPDASFLPPHEMKEPDMKLQGFVWHKEKRPNIEEVLMPRDSTFVTPVENNPSGVQPVSQGIRQTDDNKTAVKPAANNVAKPAKEKAGVTTDKPSAVPAATIESKPNPTPKPVQRPLADPSRKEAIRKAPMVKD